jgi:hypothetical protein
MEMIWDNVYANSVELSWKIIHSVGYLSTKMAYYVSIVFKASLLEYWVL